MAVLDLVQGVRRLLIAFALLAAAGPPGRAADTWPTRPVRWIVPYVAGGSTDITARLLAPGLSADLGQPVLVENRPGAAGNLGTEVVVNAAPDGHTILFATVANAINDSLYTNLPFALERDLAPVSLLTKLPNVVDVNPDLPITSIAGLIEYARAHPGKLNFGSGGTGTSIHLSGELFKTLAHVDMVHVPYRGAAVALADLMAGQIQLLFDNLPGSIEHIRSGRVRGLAVTSATRSPAMPDLPTVAEAGVPGYEATAWFGVSVPAKTPATVVARLNRAVVQVLAQPAVLQRLSALGSVPTPGTPAEMAAFVHGEIAKWAKVIAEAHVTPP